MKKHYYFLLNIKHGASQLYLGPKYNCEAPGRGRRGGGGLFEAPGGGASERPSRGASNYLAPALRGCPDTPKNSSWRHPQKS